MRLERWGSVVLQLWLACGSCLHPNPATAAADSGQSGRESTESIDATLTDGGWRRVQGTSAAAGRAAILHTMDFERSDPRLAGILVQCGARGIEVIVVVVEPFPPHSQPLVTLKTPEEAFQASGSIIPTGAGIRLPWDPTRLTALSRNKPNDLEVTITTEGTAMTGFVALTGLPKAFGWLKAECVQK